MYVFNLHLYNRPACFSQNKRPKIEEKVQIFPLMLAAILENSLCIQPYNMKYTPCKVPGGSDAMTKVVGIYQPSA